VGDFWNNGQRSVLVANVNAKPVLLINSVVSHNHWVELRTIGTKSNRDAIGAKIMVQAGKRALVGEVRNGSSSR